MTPRSSPLRQGPVKKASEYRQHAKECRALASQAVSEEHRKQLSTMADTWETLAVEREKNASKEESHFSAPSTEAASTPDKRITH